MNSCEVGVAHLWTEKRTNFKIGSAELVGARCMKSYCAVRENFVAIFVYAKKRSNISNWSPWTKQKIQGTFPIYNQQQQQFVSAEKLDSAV